MKAERTRAARADEGLAFMLRYENIAWYENGAVRILDRRVYPARTEFVTCRSHTDVARAIADMITQSGGPYTAAAMGMALAAWECRDRPAAAQEEFLAAAAYTLSHARPTTTAKMQDITARALLTARAAMQSGDNAAQAVFDQAVGDLDARYLRHEAAGRHLAAKIPMGGTVMTQCFAETIIGMLLRACRERGSAVRFICPETRPFFQGARLTASCICDMGFDVTVITDNMPGYVMKSEGVDLFTSAADVICMDGAVINKIGTFQIALCAHYFGIPYFVTGSPSRRHPSAADVDIERRDGARTLEAMGVRTAMEGVRGLYPAFDVTPPHLCSGVVTDLGVFSPRDLQSYFDRGGEELAP